MAITLNAGSGGSDIHTVTDTDSGDEVQIVAIQDEGGDEVVVSAAGAMSVEVSSALPAGTNNIGDVDIASSVALDVSAATVNVASASALDCSGATVTVDLGANNDVTVQGEDAENAPASAAPVQVGGRYDLTPRTLGDGDVGAIALDADGAVQVSDGGNSLTVDGTVSVSGTVTVDASGTAVPITDNSGSLTVDAPAGTPVNVQIGDGTDQAAVTAGGDLQVTLASETVNVASASALDVSAATVTVDATGQGDVPVTLAGETVGLSAGSNLVGDVGLSGARTSGGTTLYKNIDVDESEDAVKASAGQLYWLHAVNLSASPLYLKLYNATVASVIVGTTAPDLTFPIPTQGDTNGAGFTLSIPNGIAFGTAITIAATTGVADNDTGAPGANACVVNLGYA